MPVLRRGDEGYKTKTLAEQATQAIDEVTENAPEEVVDNAPVEMPETAAVEEPAPLVTIVEDRVEEAVVATEVAVSEAVSTV